MTVFWPIPEAALHSKRLEVFVQRLEARTFLLLCDAELGCLGGRRIQHSDRRRPEVRWVRDTKRIHLSQLRSAARNASRSQFYQQSDSGLAGRSIELGCVCRHSSIICVRILKRREALFKTDEPQNKGSAILHGRTFQTDHRISFELDGKPSAHPRRVCWP